MDDSGRPAVTQGASTPTSTPTSSFSVAHSPLFKLSRELRDYIYEYSFCSPCHHQITKDEGIPEPALLLTCKAIRDEAAVLFYSRKRLMLSIKSYDPTTMLLWNLKKPYLTRAYDFKPYNLLSFRHTGRRNWNNLKLMLRIHLAENIGSLGGRLPGSPIRSEERLFVSGLFKVVRRMRGWPWSRVEAVFDMLRPGLVKLHSEWALEQTAAYEYQSICTLLESARSEDPATLDRE